ncbi:MAG: PqqD family peptide modification chaperone [Micromonosporaceae bacterium]
MQEDLGPSTVIAPRPDVRIRRTAEGYLVSLASGPAHALSESGSFIWRAIDGQRTVADLAALVTMEYDVDEREALEDTTALVAGLLDLGLIHDSFKMESFFVNAATTLRSTRGDVPIKPGVAELGFAPDELCRKLEGRELLPEVCQAVFVAGSVARGWQHALSDIDIYVVSTDAWTGDTDGFNTVSLEPSVIPTIGLDLDGQRVELRYWQDTQVTQVFAKATWSQYRMSDPLGQKIGDSELALLVRLDSALILSGGDWVESRRAELASSAFRKMMVLRSLEQMDSLVSDVSGMTESGDVASAVLAAQGALAAAADAVIVHGGEYSLDAKWRARRLALTDSSLLSAKQYWELVTMQSYEPTDPVAWISSVLNLCRQVALDVET